ncbi:MAG: sulfatase-like hydrolase/transferase [Acidobacteriia bacterium]|nr:sulfatase-like hydrolase/transferase [Terriglobia bacterium]
MFTFQNRVDFLDYNSPRAQTEAKVNEFLDRKPKDKPFFLWANFNDPHHVWDSNAIPQPHDPARLRLPRYLPDLPGVRADLGRYMDEIGRLDGEVQSVLDIVARRGLRDNTIVVFMGDNGMAFPHGKGSLYDPGLNVPLLVRWPGKVKAGSTSRELISGEDIAPALLEAAGIAKPKEMSGQSFLKALRDERHESRQYIFGARLHHGNGPFTDSTKASTFDLSRCARSDRFKLIYNCTPQMEYQPVDSAGDPGWKEMLAAHKAGLLNPEIEQAYFGKRRVIELYDLEKDPSELNNVAGRQEYAAIERELKLALQEKMITDYDFLPPPVGLLE